MGLVVVQTTPSSDQQCVFSPDTPFTTEPCLEVTWQCRESRFLRAWGGADATRLHRTPSRRSGQG